MGRRGFQEGANATTEKRMNVLLLARWPLERHGAARRGELYPRYEALSKGRKEILMTAQSAEPLHNSELRCPQNWREKRIGKGRFCKNSAHGENEPRTGVMLVNGEAFPAHYWPHAEWTEPLPKNSRMAGGRVNSVFQFSRRVCP